ncbi:hypothetical protein [Stappia indica]|uniref:Uncharacterized protein n=1 Tax=Stappia indica TaxID=538381 RepID=A0A857C8F8_9HYPH|nr:hypothetical protein [Stappia indica]QGZ35316.1 hypothetical protein GH266_12930 [Stappia indica]
MRIEQGRRPAAGPGEYRRVTSTVSSTGNATPASAARAVVPVAPVSEPRSDRFARLYRPQAAFLAQLIAMREHVPQLRVRRRAAPEQALEAYRLAERQPRLSAPGRVLAVSR